MLAWHLEWGEHVDFLEQVAASGRSPKALQARPSLEPHLTFWWNAFVELSRDRPVHMGAVGSIPFTSLDRWAQRYGITGLNEFDTFRAVMRAMDAVVHAHGVKQMRKGARR